VAVAGELDGRAVGGVGRPLDEHQRRALGDAEQLGVVRAGGDGLEPLVWFRAGYTSLG